MFDLDLDEIEKKVLSRSMDFSGPADEVAQKKEFYSIAVKATIQALKECAKHSKS